MAQVIGKSSGYLWKSAKKYYVFSLLTLVVIVAVPIGIIQLIPIVAAASSLGLMIGIILLIKTLDVAFGNMPRDLRRRGDKFMKGNQGENDCQKVLERLPGTYTVFRDVLIDQHGNIDYVVVGPNGVFATEVKNHRGKIDFDGHHLTINGRPFPEKDVLGQATGEAVRLSKFLESAMGHRVYVNAILVFTNNKVTMGVGCEPVSNVLVLRADFLNQAIVAHKGSLDTAQIEIVTKLLAQKVKL